MSGRPLTTSGDDDVHPRYLDDLGAGRIHHVRLTLSSTAADAEVLSDLAAPTHRLRQFDAGIVSDDDGQVHLMLTVTASDIWTAVLNALGGVRRCGYDVVALQVWSER